MAPDGEHTQLIASILPGPQGRGCTGVAQVFPERTPLIVVQVCWHQGKEGLGGQHDQLALGARHGHGQAPGLQQEVTLALGVGEIRDGGRDENQVPLPALKPLDRIHGASQVRQPRLQQGFLGPVWDHNAQPCRGIESQMRAGGLHQGFDHHRLTRIGLLGAVVVVLDEDHGMLRRERVAEPAVRQRHGWQALPVLGVKGNAVVRIDVAMEKGRHFGREAEGFVQRRAREAEFEEIRKEGEVRAGAGQVAAAGLVPGVLQDRGHLPVVPHREKLPVIPQKRRGRQRFGQVHL